MLVAGAELNVSHIFRAGHRGCWNAGWGAILGPV